MALDRTILEQYAQAFAFAGNSLLAPMSQTGGLGLGPAFWDGFPSFGDDGVAAAIAHCRAFAQETLASGMADEDAVRKVSVEYTELFIGPPRPAAPPWETFYAAEGVTSGFGQATFEMQALLREAGLEMSGENNQYADHVGIELLYLSVLCERGEGEMARAFATEHLLRWIPSLKARVTEANPEGYLLRILELACALLNSLVKETR